MAPKIHPANPDNPALGASQAKPTQNGPGADETTKMPVGGIIADPVDVEGGLLGVDGPLSPSESKKDTSIRLRAEALEGMFHRTQGADLKHYKGGYQDVTWGAPEWAFGVEKEVREAVGIQVNDARAMVYLRNAIRTCAGRISDKPAERPENAVRFMETTLQTEVDRLEWYGAHASFRERVEDLIDLKSRSWTEVDCIVEAETRFREDVGKALCASLREGAGSVNPNIPLDGTLGMPLRCTELGAYPLYYVTKDGGVLSPEAVIENLGLTNDVNDPQWFVVSVGINYEDANLICDHTGKRIRSAYAEDDAETSDH